MLTLLRNIERFNRRYNKKRGSAMIMVLMTMAIIMCVGTSMTYVTLSSFSNSIADTQRERAYNAALTISDSLKGSEQLTAIIDTYKEQVVANGADGVDVQFYNNNGFTNEKVNYTVINGVKCYIRLTNISEGGSLNKVLVDVRGVKGSQESTVSFKVNHTVKTTTTSIEDTFGSSFVVSNNMGSEKTDPRQVFKRIEGDVSINCFENDEDGDRVMKTRLFNPLVLEGVTGNIYANGDLIIGAQDNMIRVQGNVYVDGNLTIRGLALGVNLPALMKKYYNKKYISYYTYAKKFVGSIEVPWNEPTIQQRNGSNAVMGEAMYEKFNGEYRPIQVYDKISHYTLMDLAPEDAETYTFWTKNYDANQNEQVTITLRIRDDNGNLVPIDAEFNQKVNRTQINNAQYLGASMYYDRNCTQPIVQFPQGGNIYCSGDIIFDTVNRGMVYTYDAGFREMGMTDEKQDEGGVNNWRDKLPGSLGEWLGNLEDDLINKKYDYYSLSYGGKIPVHTKIEGDVFCQGRMIIAPDVLYSYVNYKGFEKLGISKDYSRTDNYINNTIFKNANFVFRDSGRFLKQIKENWQDITGKKWGESYDFGTVNLGLTLERYNTNDLVSGDSTISEIGGRLDAFIKAYNAEYNKQTSSGSESMRRLKEKFEQLGKDEDGSSILKEYSGEITKDNEYIDFGGYHKGGKAEKEDGYTWEKDKSISAYRTPEFSENSNLYIQNSPVRKGMSCNDASHIVIYGVEKYDPCTREKYADSDEDDKRVVENTDQISKEDVKVSVVNGISYTAALTVRYCKIKVNNIYCDGAISVLQSQIKSTISNEVVDFSCGDAIEVTGKYYATDYVKNELKRASVYDFLRAMGKSDNQILKEYFGVDGNTNNFLGTTNFVFNEADNSRNKYDETWFGWAIPEEITHNRKVFVLRAHYEMTETVEWTNNENWRYKRDRCHWGTGTDSGKRYHNYIIREVPENWTYTTTYSPGKYVADLMYCFEDNVSYDDHFYKNEQNDATGKIIRSDGKVKKVEDAGLTKEERKVVDYLQQNGNCINLAQTAFIDFRTTPIGKGGKTYNSFKEYFKEEHVAGFNTATNNPNKTTGAVLSNKVELSVEKCNLSDVIYHEEHDKYLKKKNSPKKVSYYKSASRTRTATYNFKLKSFGEITGGKELNGKDHLVNKLSGSDILRSHFFNEEYLVAMFSNGRNDFDGIITSVNGVGKAIGGGGTCANFKKPANINNSNDPFECMKDVTAAFNDKPKYGAYDASTGKYHALYGMYLLKHDDRYYDVDVDAKVRAIFDEICSSSFATVVEANMDETDGKNELEAMLKKLQDEKNIVEYNAIEVYGKNLGSLTKDYMAINPETRKYEQLHKKYIGWEEYRTDAEKYESWFEIHTLNEDSWLSTRLGYIVLRNSSDVEDDSTLRLMRFYNKQMGLSAPLVADSTFGVDPNYNDYKTYNGLGVSNFRIKIEAKRSEVQYTINKNTYFNFGDYTDEEIDFGSDMDTGTDQKVRTNFLIDTSKSDVYIFFRGKDEKTANLKFRKCTFQVTGKNNAYIMLLGDTSFSASAYAYEINNSWMQENKYDKSDERVGTHFKSGTYQKYGIGFKRHGENTRVKDLSTSIQTKARASGARQMVGNMFIVGMGKNVTNFGRGGLVNALVYIPHGKYTNKSAGFLGFIPIGSSSNNEASIIANDIFIGGSSRGKLIFTSYDVARMGGKNSTSGGLNVMDTLISNNSSERITKWVAGDYYYG